MAKWTAFPHDNADYSYDTAALKKNWARLHAGEGSALLAAFTEQGATYP